MMQIIPFFIGIIYHLKVFTDKLLLVKIILIFT